MKKLAALVGSMLLFAATTASAEHRLLVTDIVDPQHAEGQATWEFTHFNEDINKNINEAVFSLGFGIVKNLELDITLPYVLREKEEGESRTGWGNLVLGTKYRILKEEPVTVTAGFDFGLDTGADAIAEEHNFVYSPWIGVSKEVGHGTTPYATYRATFNSNGADIHALAIGVEKELNHTVTLDAKFDTAFFVNEEERVEYGFDLGAYLQVAKNFYIIPSVGVSRVSSNEENATALKAGAALYYLY